MKKVSVKKHIKVDSIIEIENGYIYKVIELHERKFKCILINYLSEGTYYQEFYYNIDMTIYNETIKNY
jgi:hypothetical protein